MGKRVDGLYQISGLYPLYIVRYGHRTGLDVSMGCSHSRKGFECADHVGSAAPSRHAITLSRVFVGSAAFAFFAAEGEAAPFGS